MATRDRAVVRVRRRDVEGAVVLEVEMEVAGEYLQAVMDRAVWVWGDPLLELGGPEVKVVQPERSRR